MIKLKTAILDTTDIDGYRLVLDLYNDNDQYYYCMNVELHDCHVCTVSGHRKAYIIWNDFISANDVVIT